MDTNGERREAVGWGRMALAVSAVLGLQVALCVQGIDLTDEGFWASFYQSIFVSPSSVKYGFMYWLTGVVGGAWLKAFPSLGVLGLRLLSVGCQTITMALAWYVLRPFVRHASLGWGFLAGVVLIHNNILSFYANPFSALLLMASVACAWRFLRCLRLRWLVLSGAVVGLAVFARTPNILGVAGVSIPLLALLLKRPWSWRTAGRWCVCYVAGFAGGVVVTVGAMAALGHVSLFLDALRLLSEMGAGKGDQAHHSAGALVLHQLRVYGLTGVLALLGLAGAGGGGWFFARLAERMGPRAARTLSGAAAWGMAACLSYGFVRYSAMGLVYYVALAVGLSMAVHECMVLRVPADRAVAWWSALLLVLVLPLGSNVPHFIGRYALWLLLPLSVDGLRKLGGVREAGARTDSSCAQVCWPRLFCAAALAGVFIASAVLTVQQPYRDSQTRARLSAPLRTDQTLGLLTTPERAAVLSDLLQRLRPDVKPGDCLLAYADMPMVHVLTDTRPALENAWPKLYAPDVFGKKLSAVAGRNGRLPAVLRQLTNLGMSEWPLQPVPYLDAPSNLARTALLDHYLKSNGYTCKWQTDHFDFWVAPN